MWVDIFLLFEGFKLLELIIILRFMILSVIEGQRILFIF